MTRRNGTYSVSILFWNFKLNLTHQKWKQQQYTKCCVSLEEMPYKFPSEFSRFLSPSISIRIQFNNSMHTIILIACCKTVFHLNHTRTNARTLFCFSLRWNEEKSQIYILMTTFVWLFPPLFSFYLQIYFTFTYFAKPKIKEWEQR